MRSLRWLATACALVTASAPGAARAEPWDFANDPLGIDPTFRYAVGDLPLSGTTATLPHPGWFWSTWQDSINYRWNGRGSLSPAEKFAFMAGRPSFVEEVSRRNGILSASTGTACWGDAGCAAGEHCGTLSGQQGFCVPSWFGICNGWAGFVVNEPAAVAAVTRDGVIYYPSDIEALMDLLYADALTYRQIGDRCDQSTPSVDSTGRDTDPTCRNLNAGAFHVLVSNRVGVRNAAFVVNENSSGAVWNRPVVDYKVKNARNGALLEVTADTALVLLGFNDAEVPLQSGIALAGGSSFGAKFTANSDGRYVFRARGTGSLALDVLSAGTSLCDSVTDGSIQQCVLDLGAGDEVDWLLSSETGVSNASVSIVSARAGAPSYVFDPGASRFYFVSMQAILTGTVEPSTQPPAGPYVASHQHEYQYVLEADDGGNVIGGEWASGSKTGHPNFAWVPVAPPSQFGGGLLRYSEAKSLLDESIGLRTNHTSHLVNPRVLSRSAAHGVAPVIVTPPGWQY